MQLKTLHKIGIIVLMIISSLSLQAQDFRGITLALGPESASTEDFKSIVELGCNTIGLVPIIFYDEKTNHLHQNSYTDWKGLSDMGLISYIRMAHDHGLKVMLKPQIYINEAWAGEIELDDTEWEDFEKQYRSYILNYAHLAEEEKVALLCVGTEMKTMVNHNSQFWFKLLDDVRERYSGKLTYSANWDAFEKIDFWSELDYIGISAYFPLSNKTQPSVQELNKAWKSVRNKIRRYSLKNGKPVLFTEFGYLSTDEASNKHWIIEENFDKYNVNESAQYNAYESLFSQFNEQAYWKGGFIWKWYTQGFPRPDNFDKDYSPQGKKALECIKKWYNAKAINARAK